jgi:hypothetical protein
MLRSGKILALAVEDSSILVAQLHKQDHSYNVTHTNEFVLPQGTSYNSPTDLGQSLKKFLHQGNFTAKNTVVGIPAKWIMSRAKDIPPVTAESLAGILKIQAQQDFSIDFDELVFDYSGHVSQKQPSSILLVAALRQKINNIVQTAQSAGLKTRTVTCTSLAISLMSAQSSSTKRYVLYLRPDYAELLGQDGKYFQMIKHLSIPGFQQHEPKEMIVSLAMAVNRSIALAPNGQAGSKPEKMFIYNAAAIEAETLQALTKEISLAARVVDLNEPIENLDAAALAMTGTTRQLLGIDFLNSHLNPPKQKLNKKLISWAIAGVVTLLFCCLLMLLDWQNDKRQVTELSVQLQQMQPDIATAEEIVKKVTFTRGWYQDRPRFLDCLQQLTIMFPQQPNIWVTSLALRENTRAIVTGRALNETSVLDVLDKIKASVSFSDVQMLYMRDAGRGSREVSFAIDFSFKFKE